MTATPEHAHAAPSVEVKLGTHLDPTMRERLSVTGLAALHEAGIHALPSSIPGAIRIDGLDPHDSFRASQVARRANGAPLWADVVEWAESNVRNHLPRLARYVRAGILPEGWQP